MADNGPQERPPFNDPKDPRWYSDPGRPPAAMPPYGASPSEASPYGTPPPGVRPGGYGMSEPKGLSITALVCGVVAIFTGGFLVIPQILAVVFGHLALKREPSGKALALTGLIIGYVMVALTVLVVALFIPLIAFAFTAAP
ncbi:hypothetical protein IWX75_000109 [Arthrobacter sp. CAN_A6]|uniref:DUF4190 domain-containing protein n=1 Tax=Arthrobacter sp. CAN_A6 TaxID=2787721 RepID=UPI0018C8F268